MGLVEKIKSVIEAIDESEKTRLHKMCNRLADRFQLPYHVKADLLQQERRLNRDYSFCRGIIEPFYEFRATKRRFEATNNAHYGEVYQKPFRFLIYSVILSFDVARMGAYMYVINNCVGAIKNQW